MNNIIEKLSSYNFFNYLLPGIVFSITLSKITSYNIIVENLFLGFFVYYFIGLVISRFGSLIIEPFLKSVKFLKFTNYKDFSDAEKSDLKINILSESNNMYRTLTSMLLMIIIFKGYDKLSESYTFFNDHGSNFLLLILLAIFLFAYRKQTRYITKRIKNTKS